MSLKQCRRININKSKSFIGQGLQAVKELEYEQLKGKVYNHLKVNSDETSIEEVKKLFGISDKQLGFIVRDLFDKKLLKFNNEQELEVA